MLITMMIGCSSPPKNIEERLYTNRNCVSADNIHRKGNEESPELVAYTVGMALFNVAADELIAKWKEDAAGGELQPVVASENLYHTPAMVPACVLLVRGVFTDKDSEDYKPEILVDRLIRDQPDVNGTAAQRIADLGGYKVDPLASVSHVIEIAILTPIPPHKPNSMKFAPVFAWIGESVNGDLQGNRSAGLVITLTPTDAKPSASIVPMKNLTIGKAYRQSGEPVDLRFSEAGDELKKKYKPECDSEKNPPPPEIECRWTEYTQDFAEESAETFNFFAVKDRFAKDKVTPYNLSVSFTEVKPGNATSAFFAKVAEKVKPDAVSSFQKKYPPPSAD